MAIASDIGLDHVEFDALTELINIGVNRGASSLAQMVGQQVLLSVPSVAVLSRERAAQVIGGGESGLVGVQQTFRGEISGEALLIFPETNSLELVRALTGGDLPLEDIIDLEHEALAETGNVILNCCLGTIANMLNRSLTMSLPAIVKGNGSSFFFAPETAPDNDVVLFVHIDFHVSTRGIRGYIAFMMDVPTLHVLGAMLRDFVGREAGGIRDTCDAGR